MIFFAIPFFKNAEFLTETLKSLLAQTSPKWCAIVLDDSLDSTEARAAQGCVETLADPRISYQKNAQNIGMAANWNQGLELGKTHPSTPIGTSILHADDRLLPHYVEKMLWAFDASPSTSAFFCKAEIIDGKGNRSFSFTDFYKQFLLPPQLNGMITLKGIEGVRPLISGNFIMCPTLCFRSKNLTRGFNPNLKMVTDFEFTLDLLFQNQQLQGIYSESLFEYRRHSANTTNLMNQSLERFREESALYTSIAHRLEQQGFPELAHQAQQKKIIQKNLLFLMMKSLFSGQLGLVKQYFIFLKKIRA